MPLVVVEIEVRTLDEDVETVVCDVEEETDEFPFTKTALSTPVSFEAVVMVFFR